MKYLFFIGLFLFFLVSCKSPKQPEFTESERVFFENLESKHNCKIIREISPDFIQNLSKKSDYLVRFDFEGCNNFDSIINTINSKDLASSLFSNVLNNDTVYSTIQIMYNCSLGNDNYQTKTFDFICKELK